MDIKTRKYSDRSIVVYGNTKPYKEELKKLNGAYCPHLTDENGDKFSGWVFSAKRKDSVEEWIDNLKNGNTMVAPPSGNVQTVHWTVPVPKIGMIATLIDGDKKYDFPVTDIAVSTNGNVIKAFAKSESYDYSLIITNGMWQLWGYPTLHQIVFRENF